MFRLSLTTDYAIRAMVHLATCYPEASSIKDVAAAVNIPAAYLAKVIRLLSQSGLLLARRGNKGGIRLAFPPAAISIQNISEAIDGPNPFSGCLLGAATCSDARHCPAHTYWQQARTELREQLELIHLADMIAFRERVDSALAGAGISLTGESA
jgi:Rrf2 family protein